MIKINKIEEFQKHDLVILHTQRGGNDEWFLPGLGSIHCNFKNVEKNFHGHLETPADFRIFPSHGLVKFRKIRMDESRIAIPNPIESPYTNLNLRQEFNLGSKTVIGRVGRSDLSIYKKDFFKLCKKLAKEIVIVWLGASDIAKKRYVVSRYSRYYLVKSSHR